MKKLQFIAVLFGSLSIAYSQCINPSSLSASNLTQSSALLSFVSSGSSPWQIQYGLAGFTLGRGNKINVSTTSTAISNLSGATSYDFYARDTCNGTASSWAGPHTFTTLCTGVMNAPVFFDFEASNWQASTNPVWAGGIATCWDVIPQNSPFTWSVGPPFLTQLQTGPETDHTKGLGKYLHIGSYGNSTDVITTLRMPQINLSGLQTPELSFWYHMYGAGIDSLKIQIKEPNDPTWTTVLFYAGQQQPTQRAVWKKATVPLSQYLNKIIQVQFVGTRPGYSPYVNMAIDDLFIGDPPSCPKSTSFQNVSNSNTSVLLDWVSTSNGTWQIEYGPKGFIPGNGTFLNTSSHPFTILGLTPSSSYDFYLKDICSPTDHSVWTGPVNVYTDCAPVLAPYSNNFEDSTWIPSPLFNQHGILNPCWDRDSNQPFFWETASGNLFYSLFAGPSANHTLGGSKYLAVKRSTFWGYRNTSITSPIIDLDNISNPELTFWYHMYGGNIAGMDVAVDSGDGYYLVKSYIGQQQTSSTALWKEGIFSLTAYAGKKVKVRFTGISEFTFSNVCRISIDDFSLKETPTCPKPTNIEVFSKGYTQADLQWLTGGANHWQIRYKSYGGSYSYQNSSSNPFILTGLQPGSTYTIWVRDSCGPNNMSDWNGPVSFRTLCSPLPTPYFENFDGSQFIPRHTYFYSGSIDSCWHRSHNEGFFWDSDPSTYITSTTGPMGDHTTGGGKYLATNLMTFVNRDSTAIETPKIDLSNLVIPEMSFWYHMFGNSITALYVQINNGAGWVQLDTILGQQQSTKAAPWKEKIVDLSAYRDDTVQIRFIGSRIALSGVTEIAIDDLHIYETPICDKPANLTLQNITSTKAILNWVSGGASRWMLKFRPTLGNYVYRAASSNTSFPLYGLMPDTRYEVWVQDSCGPGDGSLWVGPLIIKTDCIPTQAPYYESFDGSDWTISIVPFGKGKINSCWRISDTTYLSWLPTRGNNINTMSGPLGSRTGSGKYLSFDNVLFALPLMSAELYSPAIVISNLTQPELNFWYHMYGSNIDKLEIYAQQLDNTRTLIQTIPGQQHTSKTAAWSQRTISLTPYINDTIKIVFVGYKSTGFSSFNNISIDDVEIVDAFCSTPGNLSTSNAKAHSIDLNWASTNLRSNLEYGPAGHTKGQGTHISNVSPIYTLTGLQPLTTYEFYVLDSCRASSSAWVGPFAFTTSCVPPVAGFTHQAPNLNASFTGATSTGTGLNYSWDFGDGNSGTGLNLSHTYAFAGTYPVSMIVTDSCGLKDTLVKTITICDEPTARINYTRTGVVVSFDGSSSTSAIEYYWNFGPAGNYIIAKPVARFPSTGTYNIYLAIKNSCGERDTTFMSIYICDKPTATFTAKVGSTTSQGMTVDFDGSQSKDYDSFIWDFGDGNTDTSNIAVRHIYTTPGLHYLVTLITHVSCGLADTMSYTLNSISLEEEANSTLEIYPNPADDKLMVTLKEGSRQAQFSWFDASGKSIAVQVINSRENQFEFNTSKLTSGSYILSITTEKGSQSVKVTVR